MNKPMRNFQPLMPMRGPLPINPFDRRGGMGLGPMRGPFAGTMPYGGAPSTMPMRGPFAGIQPQHEFFGSNPSLAYDHAVARAPAGGYGNIMSPSQMRQLPQFQALQTQENELNKQQQQIAQGIPEYNELMQLQQQLNGQSRGNPQFQPSQGQMAALQQLQQRLAQQIEQNPQMQDIRQQGLQLNQQYNQFAQPYQQRQLDMAKLSANPMGGVGAMPPGYQPNFGGLGMPPGGIPGNPGFPDPRTVSQTNAINPFAGAAPGGMMSGLLQQMGQTGQMGQQPAISAAAGNLGSLQAAPQSAPAAQPALAPLQMARGGLAALQQMMRRG